MPDVFNQVGKLIDKDKNAKEIMQSVDTVISADYVKRLLATNVVIHNTANLSNENFSGADLRSSSLKNVNLTGAIMSGADLSGADLSGANLSGADLSGVIYNQNTILKCINHTICVR